MSGKANSWKWLSVAAAAVLALAVFAGTALAAAPSATTGPTTAVGSTTATVTGTVDPGGQATTWDVEYGTSTSYGSKTASKSAGSGTAAVDVSSALTGLHAGTTYHYRVVATNGAGTSHGTDAVFTTTVPPDVTTGAASSITASAATLNGTVDPNSRATTFYFEYGTSTSYGTKTATKSAGSAASAQSESAGISGLQTGRVYHFRIVASSDAGTTTGKDASFTTSSAPDGRDDRCVVRDADLGDSSRNGDGERALDHPLVRVRHDDGLRNEDVVDECRLRHERELGDRVREEPQAWDDVPLSPGRAELEREDVRRGQDVLDGRRSVGADRCGAERRSRRRGSDRVARHQRPFDDLAVRLRHLDEVRQVDRRGRARARNPARRK